MRVLALFMILFASGSALAQTQPLVRAQVKPESVNVGEAAQLTVTVLVPTWFTRPPVYPPFELANAMTRMPADSSYPIRERVGGESWSGIVRTYEIYPLLGATYRLAGQAMTVTFANPGSNPISVDVEVPEIVVKGVVPEGAESLDPYLAGSKLELALEVEGELDELEVGDAIVLAYRAELDGLPAIFLPPLGPGLELAGVSAYRDLPEVQDGETARRTEKITLVFEAGGEFSIPGIELRFWNTASRSVETATADGLVVSVQGPPVPLTTEADTVEAGWQRIAAITVGAVALLFIIWRGTPALVRHYREAAERRRQTEAYAFGQLSKALGSGEGPAAYEALLRWIGRLESGMDTRTFAARYGDTDLVDALTGFSASMYRDDTSSVDGRELLRRLAAARGRYLSRDSDERSLKLPPLNP
jgi:hypothetical protein